MELDEGRTAGDGVFQVGFASGLASEVADTQRRTRSPQRTPNCISACHERLPGAIGRHQAPREIGSHRLTPLDLDVDPEVPRQHAQRLFESRNTLATPRIQTADFLESKFAQATGAVGGSIDRLVVEHDDLAVGRTTKIKLDLVDTERNGASQSGQRVLGRLLRPSSMRTDTARRK